MSYLDDIIVYSKNMEEHEKTCKGSIEEYKKCWIILLNRNKCNFLKKNNSKFYDE